MKREMILICIVLLVLAVPALCEEAESPPPRSIAWEFEAAPGEGNWTGNSDVTDLAIRGGMLVGNAGGNDPIIVSPEFTFKPEIYDMIEILMSSEREGDAQLFWANTNEGQYGGFSPDKVINFRVPRDMRRPIRIYPFWHADKQIIKIRIDPPPGEFRIAYVRIKHQREPVSPARMIYEWNFAAGDMSWSVLQGYAAIRPEPDGMHLESNPQVILGSPTLRVSSEINKYVTVRMKVSAGQSGTLGWVTNTKNGIKKLSFPLKPDGQMHTYVLKVFESKEWTDQIRLLALQPSDAPKADVTIESIAVSPTPMGPADVSITHFGAEEAIPRTECETTIFATVANTGGQDAGPVHMVLTLPAGLKLVSGNLAQEISRIAPGEEAAVHWKVRCVEEKEAELSVSAEAQGIQKTFALAHIKWKKTPSNEALGPGGVVPPPKAAPTSYLVGAYYFPGWPTYDRWAVLDGYPERRPVLGYYREGDPEIADWHIKWALEHGVSFFVYDWYWSAGARQLEHALHKGFLKSRYRDMFKFCLLWANHNPPGTSSAADMDAVVSYWLDNYFLLPNYLKLDGKPVVVIFSPHRLTEDMGSEEVKASFERMREECRKRGLGGLYIVACCGPSEWNIRRLESEGYDALTGYNYPAAGDRGNLHAPYAWMVEEYPRIWAEIDRYAQIPYIPVTEPGWDSRPWHGEGSRIRTGKSPQLFRKMLEEARAFVDTPGRALPAGQKIVLIEAWNEWGEGDYIEPHREWGFDYLDAVRQVFCTNGPHEDVIPEDVGLGPYELPKPEPICAWDFESKEDAEAWSPQGVTDFGVRNGCLVGRSVGNDPAFYGGGTDIDSSKFKTVQIRMRLNKGREAQLFWACAGRGFSEDSSVRFPVTPDGEFHTYSIAVGGNPNWSGRIRSFRIDPCSEAGADIAIDYFRIE